MKKNLYCMLFGHKYYYDFPSMPSNLRCKRCKAHWVIDWEKSEFGVGKKGFVWKLKQQ